MARRPPQLKRHTIFLMIGVALLFDAIQAILDLILLGWLFVPIAYLTFIIWFWMHGISPMEIFRKRSAAVGFGVVFEILTAGILPAMTFTVARIAFDYKIKEMVSGEDEGAPPQGRSGSQGNGAVVGNIGPKTRDNDESLDKAA